MLEKSKSTLRFEITHRKPKLKSIFGRDVTYEDVCSEDYIVDLMNKTIETLCDTKRYVPMTHQEMTKAIYDKYSKKEAYNLFGFANTYYHWKMDVREFNRKFLKDMHTASFVYKNKAKLKEAGVDLLVTNPYYKAFDLTIPSTNPINTQSQVAEIAVAIRDLRSYNISSLTASSNSS